MDAYFAQFVDFWIACRNWNFDRPALTFPDCKSEEKERDGKWKGGAGGPIQVQGCREGGGGS